jgi:hypothetical protein
MVPWLPLVSHIRLPVEARLHQTYLGLVGSETMLEVSLAYVVSAHFIPASVPIGAASLHAL